MKIRTYTASLWSINAKSAAACPNVPTSQIQKKFQLNFVLRICTTSTWMKFISPNPSYITPPNNLEAKTLKMVECSSSETSVTLCQSTLRMIKNLNLYFFSIVKIILTLHILRDYALDFILIVSASACFWNWKRVWDFLLEIYLYVT